MTKRKAICLIQRIISLVLIMVIFLGCALPADAASKEPKYNAQITKKNILKLLDAYDSDGAYILRSDKSGSYMYWFNGARYMTDEMDTAVHETFHHISFDWGGDKMYVGSKKFVFVPQTIVFSSAKAAKKIPKRLRTFRYSTYMTNSQSTNMHSVVDGPYGLLNEMSAYSWGMNNSIKLYPYYKKNNMMNPFYISCSNNKNAYAEFTYFILFYLDYAKTNDKAVYKSIMKNSQFKKVYKNTDKRFKNLIKKYNSIAQKDRNYFYYPKASDRDYTLLMKEISKSKYQKIYKELIR